MADSLLALLDLPGSLPDPLPSRPCNLAPDPYLLLQRAPLPRGRQPDSPDQPTPQTQMASL